MRRSAKIASAIAVTALMAVGAPLAANADSLVQAGSIRCSGAPAPYAYIGATVHGQTTFNHNNGATIAHQSFNDLLTTTRFVTVHYTSETGTINTYNGATATGAGMSCDS